MSDDDQDYEVILKRLIKLEKVWLYKNNYYVLCCWGNIFIFQQIARNRKRDTEASEMNTKVTLAIESVNEMKRTVENVVFIRNIEILNIFESQYSAW